MRIARELLPDVAHVALQIGVVVDAHLPADLGVLLLADRQLLGLAEERHLLLARNGIGRARGAERDDRRKKEAGSFHDGDLCNPCTSEFRLFSRAPDSRSTSS